MGHPGEGNVINNDGSKSETVCADRAQAPLTGLKCYNITTWSSPALAMSLPRTAKLGVTCNVTRQLAVANQAERGHYCGIPVTLSQRSPVQLDR